MYHLWTVEEWVLQPMERFQNRTYQEVIRSLSQEEGLNIEMQQMLQTEIYDDGMCGWYANAFHQFADAFVRDNASPSSLTSFTSSTSSSSTSSSGAATVLTSGTGLRGAGSTLGDAQAGSQPLRGVAMSSSAELSGAKGATSPGASSRDAGNAVGAEEEGLRQGAAHSWDDRFRADVRFVRYEDMWNLGAQGIASLGRWYGISDRADMELFIAAARKVEAGRNATLIVGSMLELALNEALAGGGEVDPASVAEHMGRQLESLEASGAAGAYHVNIADEVRLQRNRAATMSREEWMEFALRRFSLEIGSDNRVHRHFRTGEPGTWRESMSEENVRFMKTVGGGIIQKMLVAMGYEKDDKWGLEL
eukprot:jgi/Mesvir1/5001/Mv23078-RA.2